MQIYRYISLQFSKDAGVALFAILTNVWLQVPAYFCFSFVLKFKIMNFLPILTGRRANETKGLRLSKIDLAINTAIKNPASNKVKPD